MDAGRLIRVFTAPLPPLPKPERIGIAVLSLLVALTRWPAVAKTLWDWDEALFVLALRDYDVVAYHPHPPGFPLFVALARLIPLDAFHALQTVVVLASLFVFPAMFFLARELRASTFVAAGSALILAFLPNVWLYGGTAFSDVPSLTLSLAACALLLRGCRDDRALLAGGAVLGLAASIRPQNLLIALVPFAIAFLARRSSALKALGIAAAIVIVCYGGAVFATGSFGAYWSAIAEHGRYIRRVDSFLSDIRPSLFRVFDDFFLRPFRAPLINVILLLLGAIALWRRRAYTIAALAIFGPFLLFAWLFLDFHSASRFSIAYMPLFAILAADGIEIVPERFRLPLLASLVAVLFAWTFPALRVVHSTEAPPVAAMRFLRASADPMITFVDVDPALGPHAEVYLQGFERNTKGRRVVLRIAEGKGDQSFTRPRERLAGIVRPRYFEVGISW